MVNTLWANPNMEPSVKSVGVLFAQKDVVIYFESQEQAEASIQEATENGLMTIRLYIKEA
jgi:hypothetical protein